MNHASVSFATARAITVLPVPGGPYNNTPRGGWIPRRSKTCGNRKGSSIISRTLRICEDSPPMSSYEILCALISKGFNRFKYVDLLIITVPSGVVDVTRKSHVLVPKRFNLTLSPVLTA